MASETECPHSALSSGASSAGVKVATARLPSPKNLVGSPTQILAQFPKQHQQSPKQLAQASPIASSLGAAQTATTPPGSKPTIQIKQESGELQLSALGHLHNLAYPVLTLH